MNNIKDMTELAICLDITSRMALFAMAKSLSAKEIDFVFDQIEGALSDEGGYEKCRIRPLIDDYRKPALLLSEVFAEDKINAVL